MKVLYLLAIHIVIFGIFVCTANGQDSSQFTEYLNRCQASVNRTNRAGTQCDTVDGIMVKKIRFNDDEGYYCIIVDRRHLSGRRESEKLYIRTGLNTRISALWTGGTPTVSRPSRDIESVEINLTSGSFFFVFNYKTSDHPEIQVRLNQDYPDSCGINVAFDSIAPEEFACGARKIDWHIRPTVSFGSETYHGKYPWHAAIYKLRSDRYENICGGSVISSNAILTAAHCFKNVNGTTDPSQLLVKLGKYDLSRSNGRETQGRDYRVAKVIPNPDYDTNYYENDIGILKLKSFIKYTDYIQPICLSDNENNEVYTNEAGFVPGWGNNQHRVPNTILHEAGMRIVRDRECRDSKREFFSQFLNNENFCAGYKNGTSVCEGDSGGGLVFEIDGVFYLKGIVSLAVSIPNLGCDFLQYAIFTDVSKFNEWIKNAIL